MPDKHSAPNEVCPLVSRTVEDTHRPDKRDKPLERRDESRENAKNPHNLGN
jgi:hypothetical protein